MKNFLPLFFLLSACASTKHSGYPEHWWKPVPTEGAPGWEILPQAAGPGEVILSKRHELGLLSNFAATPFVFRGKRYASVEGFWQAMLFPEHAQDPRAQFKGLTWPHTRAEIEQMSAFQAKAAGDHAYENMKKMKINWVTFAGEKMDYWTSEKGLQYRLIFQAMCEKMKQNPPVKAALLSTGDLKLRPDHHQEKGAPPSWRYFEIWTEIREDLKAGKDCAS